jgi:hypothetical protein
VSDAVYSFLDGFFVFAFEGDRFRRAIEKFTKNRLFYKIFAPVEVVSGALYPFLDCFAFGALGATGSTGGRHFTKSGPEPANLMPMNGVF